jgi:diguanylate cyclase (GGDEF)-like protein
MKLSRLLVGLISLLWLVVFVATLYTVVNSTRDYLTRSMETHAQDTATSLGLSITQSKSYNDPVTIELMTSAIFDRGYYSEIQVNKVTGESIFKKRVEKAVEGVPTWFMSSFALPTPRMNAVVMDGWRKAAVVVVESHPGHAYKEMWEISKRSFWVLLTVAIISLIVVMIVLRLALRPLDDMERQADDISRRKFTILEKLPWARELHRISKALNSMCHAVEGMLNEQTELATKMRNKAYIDPVTGLMNRNDFNEQLTHLIGAPTKFSTGAVGVIRIRSFAAYNEREGRAAGDALFKRTAQLLQEIVKSYQGGLVAKLDGPEFAIVVPEITDADVPKLGDAVINGLAEIEEFPRTEQSLMPHAGFAYYRYHEGATFGKLMSAAGQALGVAQARAVPAWHLQAEGEQSDQNTTMAVEINGLFKVGLPPERVVLQYQAVRPCQVAEEQWDYRSEACIRILAADGAIVRAGLFMSTAKRLGALQLVDRVVTEKLMQHIAANGPVRGGATALNLSLESLLDKGFVDWLYATLNAKREIAKHIIIEVAEHSIVSNLEAVKAVFSRLRETGARLSIDRFGQSTATLGFLRGLEVDYIKIDGGYTRGATESTDKQFFIQALVGIAHGLGIKVVTEYVETEAEFNTIKGLMVDGAQGYFIGKPE